MSSWRSGGPGEKSSWRKKTKAIPPAAAGGKYWVSGAGSKPLISGNLVRLFIALAALLATTVGMVVYLLNTNVSTPLVSIAAIDYEQPWAPNAWAQEDQQRLKALQERSQFRLVVKQERNEETWQTLIASALEDVTPGGPGGSLVPALWGYRTLIVHLSAHSALNTAGEPCLLFTDADSLDDRTWIPLASVLSAIGDHPKVRASNARVLVVLDTGKQPPDFRCGLFVAGFIDAAREKILSLPFSDFAVLLACSEDQCAWSAPEMGGSVFGVMVASGLQGRADALAGNRDQRVSVRELARFVGAAVDGYVREYRGREQHPNLVWCGEDQSKDFELCFQSNYSASAASNYQLNARVEKMVEAWMALAEWNHRSPSHIAWQRAAATNRLARAEQLLWAGAAYTAQFETELNAASKIIESPIASPWPHSICGSSSAFLNRVHHIDAESELKSAGLVFQPPLGAQPAVAQPQSGSDAGAATAPTGAPVAGAVERGPGDAVGSEAATGEAATDSPPPSAKAIVETLTPAQQIVRWLTFDPATAGDQPPPERPVLPARPLAIGFLIRWLADHPEQVTSHVMGRMVDWLGPIVDSPSVTREEALLRTIADHMQLISAWDLPVRDRIGQLWGQYLQAAHLCELAMAMIDPRGTTALEREAAGLSGELQLVRDRIHGCETARDASDCAEDLIALQVRAEQVQVLRERLERSWRLRDELSVELPTLAQWIASPLCRMQSSVTVQDAWDLSGQLARELQSLHIQLTSAKIPDQDELDAMDQQLDRLTLAYRDALHRVFEVNAKSDRKPISDLMLSLGLRPNVYRGLYLGRRAELHRGLDKRLSDFQNVLSQEKLVQYYNTGLSGKSAETEFGKVWRVEDLPSDWSTTWAPLNFTESITGRPLLASQSAALSQRSKWAAVGGELRERWSGLPDTVLERCQASIEAMNAMDADAIRLAEEQLLTVEHHAHLLAHLLPNDRLNPLLDPTQRAQAVCNELFAMWQARRALTDFWKTPTLPSKTHAAFMLGSALGWQSATTNPARGPQQRLEQSQLAADTLAERWQAVWQNVRRGQPPESILQAELSLTEFPTGRAWIRLLVNGNSPHAQQLEENRFQAERGTGARASGNVGFSLPTGSLPEGNHQLVAWFRGHAATAAVDVLPQKPPVILAWQPDEPGHTTIRVEAEPRPERIFFVLDCSGSLETESLEIAKNTLLKLLADFHKSERQTEVAVALFGHRAEYWTSRADSYSEWVTGSLAAIHPYNDVEVIQPLAVPTEQLIQDLAVRLRALKPFGRTPLYESIRQAAKLLMDTRAGFDGDLRIVVITDGDDNVLPFNEIHNRTAVDRHKVPDEFLHTEDSLVRELGHDVRLDFVLFNFADNAGQDRLAGLVDRLNVPVRRAGRLSAGDADLLEKLRNSISGSFSTKTLPDGVTIGSRVRLSEVQSVPADRLTQPLNQFEVQIDDTAERKTVTLTGGETIELLYRRQAGLSFLPYDEGDKYQFRGQIAIGGQPYDAIMLIGVPRNVPQVRMCLQALNPQVQSLRPQQFLIELQRTKPGQESALGERVAWTSDALWENHHRSPVLRLAIRNLPELQRDSLQCRLWVADRLSGQPLPLARIKEQPVEVAPGVMLSAATELKGGRLRLTLTERRQTDAPLVHWQVVPAPDGPVEHHAYTTQVVREYIFNDPQVLSRIAVSAMPLPAVPDETWRATQWIPVPEW